MATLALVFGIFIFWNLLKRNFRDRLRFELFSIRDDLFLYGMEENYFDSKPYRYTEDFINHLIRFTDRISTTNIIIFRTLAFLWFPRQRIVSKFVLEMYTEIEKSDPLSRDLYKGILDRTDKAIMKYLILTNPVLWAVVAFYWLKQQFLKATDWKVAVKRNLSISIASIKKMASDQSELQAVA